MRCEVLTPEGVRLPLPDLTAFRFRHTDGTSADSFEVTFPTRESLLPELRKSVDFYAYDEEALCFRGRIDEVETVYADAFTTTLCGRGLAARLMDNQVEGAEYYSVELSTILERYVRPYGISAIQTQGGPFRVQLLSIGAGCSCYQVLQGFCLHAGAPTPHFLPDGTLSIAPGTGHYTLGADEILSATWRLCRYGVISQQKVIDLTSGITRTAELPALMRLGIDCRRVATRSGPFTHVIERTAWQRLEEAARELDTLTLVLPGAHPALPWDSVQVTLPELGIGGECIVTEACRQLDGSSDTTQLRLRAKE